MVNKFKKEIIKGICQNYSSEGKGIIKNKDKIIFVNGLFLNEEAEVELQYKRAGIYYGKIVKILKVSKDRIQPKCKVCTACGGCQFQQLEYQAQLDYKTNKVKEDLLRIGGIKVDVQPCKGMNKPYFYRNKIQLPLGYDYKKKEVITGFYRESSHDIIPIDKCYIEDIKVNSIIQNIKKLIKKYNLEIYNEDTRKGNFRHILIRISYYLEQIIVVFICNYESFPSRNNFIKELIKLSPEITTVVQNTNSRKTNVILGDKQKVLYGPGYIYDYLCGLKFKISPKSFYQINPTQCEYLYSKALEMANLNKEDVVLDAYSGVGTIGLIASKKVKEVFSVEIVKDAIKDGIINAKNNNISNIKFINQDASKYILDLVNSNTYIDVVIMDPPRAGSDVIFLQSVKKLKPKKIIYISCNPATLARDLKDLIDDYEILDVQPVDMFPQTYHVETVVLMSRVEGK